MSAWTRSLTLAVLAAASTWWLSGCSGKPTEKPADHHQDGDKRDGDHKDGDKKDHKDGDHDKPLTEKDVKMPETFIAGVARLEELHKGIDHHIEHGELDKVHRTAEEAALVARGMKKLAAKEIADDAKQADAIKLCEEVARFYKPLDEAADANKKAETIALHKQMGETIGKLKALIK
jgi:hypothetical protein